MALTPNKRSIMTLYSSPTDVYSHRVRIVLAEKGVTYDILDVELNHKAKEELLEINPYGSTPTLLDRDLLLYQSEVIMEYLDERFPHPPLMPVYPVARGRTRLLLHRVNKDWYSQLEIIQKSGLAIEQQNQARQVLRDSIVSVIPVFAEMPFFMSEEFSLVDCCIAPLLWRLPRLGVELPPQAKPVQEYAARLFAREAFQSSLTEAEKRMRI
ncbi:MAG: glutathione S-transferase N-terminal domain-containing protein [Gammaproteobacteria bacterium]